MAKTERGSLYGEVTARIIAELEEGRLPWVQPWDASKCLCTLPHNAASERNYSGIVLALVKLETPHILCRRGIGRSSQKAAKGADVADIIVLGARPHRAHCHVVEHALTQWGNRPVYRESRHREGPLAEGSP
jgi:hypothetical protein